MVMRKLRALVVVWALYLCGGEPVSGQAVASLAGARRPITVRDVIAMTKLGDGFYYAGGSSRGRVAQFSPDGKQFVIVLRRGNLEMNANEYSLLLWRTDAVLRGEATPQLLLQMSSSSNLEAIAAVRWLADNETLLCLGETVGTPRQVYMLNTRTGALRKLTRHPTSIVAYSSNDTGDNIAFVAQRPFESMWDEGAQQEGVVISRQSIPDLIVGSRYERGEGELFFQDAKGVRRMTVHGKIGSTPRVTTPFLSPDGKYIVVAARVPTAQVPQAWKHYRNASLAFNGRADTQRILAFTSYFERYELVDVATGTSRLLLASPAWPPNSRVVWASDSRSVVLNNAFLPYENAEGKDRAERERHSFIVRVAIPDGDVMKIGDGPQAADGGDSPPFDPAAQEGGRPAIALREGMNEPPKIYVRKPGAHQESLLLDLNPQFGGLSFGKVEEIQWKWKERHPIRGGLYYPPNYVPGRRYPLVIQTHGWTPDRFWIDGLATTAYAAQPLAAKGIMVLQVDDEHLPLQYGATGQRKEVDEAVAIYESAIAYLDRQGLIDRDRVGIIGFSHTCFYVKYALVHSRARFEAASTTEGEDGGYVQFMTNGNLFVDAYSLYGGRPFGKALKAWMQISPGFNVDKTHTPLRITTLSPHNLLLDWEWFEALTLLDKPVDMVMLQDGDHILERPSERFVSLQGNVDWFDFWLKGEEDPDPAKAEQYARWRELRKRHQSQTTMDTTQGRY